MSTFRKPHRKLVLFFAGFLTLSVLFAFIFNGVGGRRKGEGRIPASSVDQYQGSGRYEVIMAFSKSPLSKGPANDQLQAEKVSGVRAARARLVRLNPSAFQQTSGHAQIREVVFNLFDNLIFKVVLYKPSSLGVNYYRFQGRIEGDQYGLVDLIYDGTAMTGTIETNGRKFRIINQSGADHFILEEAYAM